MKVYHSSHIKGLKKLEPKESTHGEKWVYATKDIPTSAMFIGKNYDLINQIGTWKGVPSIYERFKGALKYAYKGQSGSIYVLDGKTFEEGKTSWSAEVISTQPVEVIEEIHIEDAYEYLQKLHNEGKIKIYEYPNTPRGGLENKEDIIKRVVEWTKSADSPILDDVRKFHSDVYEEICKRLEGKGIKVKIKDSSKIS
ncbi:hypothetical protein GF357_02155 [Candidatus Dojkabacteria bacterium]|nr:hypothetical protein [Candidatus Dojkabacteria bacterium]